MLNVEKTSYPSFLKVSLPWKWHRKLSSTSHIYSLKWSGHQGEDSPVQMTHSPSAWTRGLPSVKVHLVTFIFLFLYPLIHISRMPAWCWGCRTEAPPFTFGWRRYVHEGHRHTRKHLQHSMASAWAHGQWGLTVEVTNSRASSRQVEGHTLAKPPPPLPPTHPSFKFFSV